MAKSINTKLLEVTIVESEEAAPSATKRKQPGSKTSNASVHGISYQLRLGLVILLRLYKLHQENNQFDFELTFEDPEGGKFDDILVRHSSSKDCKVGIVRIQAKHTQPASQDITQNDQKKTKTNKTISEDDLLSTKKKTPFGIAMYFESFLDIHELQSKKSQTYMICTNRTLETCVSSLNKAKLKDSYIQLFLQDINVTFYQLGCAKNEQSLQKSDKILKGVVISKGYTDKDNVSIIQAFYDNFILACGSVNETELHDIAIKLLKSLLDFQYVTTYEKLHMCMFEAMIKGSKSFKPSDVEEMFKQTESGHILEYFKVSTMKDVESLRDKYSDLKLNSTALENTNLFKFLENKTFGILWFYSSCSTDVSILVIDQIVNHADHEMVLISYSTYKESDVLTDLSVAISSFNNRSVCKDNNFSRKLITITTQEKAWQRDKLTKLSTEYGVKFVIVEQLTKDEKSCVHKNYESFCFSDLTLDSRNGILGKRYNRFGTSVSLGKILKLNDNLSYLYDIIEMNEEGSKSLHEKMYEEIGRWYVDRRLVFYIEDVRKDDNFYNYNYSVFDDFDDDDEDDVEDNERHILKSNNIDDDLNIPGLKDSDNSSKVVLILNDAGSGKSTLFAKLSLRLSTIIESSYVIRLNAFTYSTDFKHLRTTDIENLDTAAVIRILYCFIHLFVFDCSRTENLEIQKRRKEATFCADLLTYFNGRVVVNEYKARMLNLTASQLFELRLFEEKMNGNLVILLLDGFDEIAPDYKQVVLKCFSKFEKLQGIRHIYVSSRPYQFISEFKQTFPGCRMYQLRHFSKNDQKNALSKYIRQEVPDYVEKDQVCLLNRIMKDLRELPAQLLSVPLFLRMAFEIHFPVIQKTVSLRNENKSHQPQTLNIFQLIEAFVDKKIQRSYLEKRGIPLSDLDKPGETERFENALVVTKNQHALLALFAIFNEESRKKLLYDNEEFEAFAYMENTKAASEKTGIIVGVQDGIPQFIIHILAEYFVAYWLYKNKDRTKIVNYFQSKPFWNRESYNIRDFLERMILKDSNDCKIHQAILNDVLWTRDFLQKDPLLAHIKDAVGRIPLHMAVVRRESDKLNQLLDIMSHESINVRDKLCQWSPLDYAFITDNKAFVKLLLERGATVNLNTLLQQICSSNLRDLLVNARNYAKWLKSNENTKRIASQLNRRIVEYFDKERQFDMSMSYEELDGLTIIEFCVKKDIVGIFERLFLPVEFRTRNPLVSIFNRLCVQAVNLTRNILVRLFKRLFVHAVNRTRYLMEKEDHLFNLVLEHKSFEIITYLIVKNKLISLPHARYKAFLACALEILIEANRMNNFQIIFEKLCTMLNINLLHDTEIEQATSLDVVHNISAQLTNIPSNFQWDCCVRNSKNVRLSLPDFDERDIVLGEFVIEALLAKAVYHRNIPFLNYIIVKTNTQITNRLIVVVMRLLAKDTIFMCHKKFIPAFNYLLNKTSDLYSVDEEGRNLLQMTAQNGCFFMIHCLIANGFNPTLANAKNGWNVLHYATYNEGVRDRVFETLDYLKDHLGVSRFALLDAMLNSDDLGANETVCSNMLNKQQHALLGMLSVSHTKIKNKLFTKQEHEQVIELMKQIKHGEKFSRIIGIISYFTPIFKHRIFADYCAARWLYENKDRMRSGAFFQTVLFWRIYNSEGVTDLFNRLALKESNECQMHMAVLNQLEDEVSELLFQKPSLALVKDALGRLPLHLAACYSLRSIVEKLLECMPLDSINTRDQLLQWSALDYAFVTGNKALINILLARGATVNLETLIRQIESKNLKKLLTRAHKFASWLQSNEYTRAIADLFYSRIVEYLIKERELDSNKHYTELNGSTVLMFCMQEHYVGIFDQLVLKTISVDDKTNLIPLLHYTIEKNLMKSFRIIFTILCQNRCIPLAEDEQFGECTYFQDDLNMEIFQKNHFPKICCVCSSKNVRLSLPEYDKDDILHDGYEIEALLARSVHRGNVLVLNYIVEITKTQITNKLIVGIMRLLPKYLAVCHKQSIAAFKYLLDRTTDLYSVDEEGRNILHMTAQNGCFFMFYCLIANEFNLTLVNAKNGWNAFHYATYNAGSMDRAFASLDYLKDHLASNRFPLVDSMLNSDSLGNIEVGFNAFITNENPLNPQMLNKQQHALLGMLSVFKQNLKNKLFTEQEHAQVFELMKQIEIGEKTSTIIEKIDNGKHIFKHRIFADYYAACWLYKNKERMRCKAFFQSKTFWSIRTIHDVRNMFNRLTLKESDGECQIHLAILNHLEDQVSELLLQKPSLALVKDALGRLPLHLAVIESNIYCRMRKTVQELLECMSPDTINFKDTLFEWSALDYAFVRGDEYNVKMLLDRGAAVNLDTSLKQLFSNNFKDLLVIAHAYTEWLQSNENTKVIAEEIYSRVTEYLIKEKQVDIYAHHAELDGFTVSSFWNVL